MRDVYQAQEALEQTLQPVRNMLQETAVGNIACLGVFMRNSAGYQGEQLGITLATATNPVAEVDNKLSGYNVDLSLPTPLANGFKIDQFSPIPSVMSPEEHLVSSVRIRGMGQGARPLVLQAVFDAKKTPPDQRDVASKLVPLVDKLRDVLPLNVSNDFDHIQPHLLLKNNPPTTPNFGLIIMDKRGSTKAAQADYPALMTDLFAAQTTANTILKSTWKIIRNTGDGDVFAQQLPSHVRMYPHQLAAYKRRELGPKLRELQSLLGKDFVFAATAGYVTLTRGQKPTSPAFWTLGSRLKEQSES